MKTLTGILFLLIYVSSFPTACAQRTSEKYRGWNSSFHAVEANYGIRLYQKPLFSDTLKQQFGTSMPFNQTIGVSFKAPMTITRGRFLFDGSISLNFIPPVRISKGGKSMELWNFWWGMMLVGQDLFPKKKNLDGIIGIGFNHGVYALTITDSLTYKYKNPYFAPKITADLRGLIGKFSLGVRSEYQFDVSKKKWKTKSGAALKNSIFSGILVQAQLGFGF